MGILAIVVLPLLLAGTHLSESDVVGGVQPQPLVADARPLPISGQVGLDACAVVAEERKGPPPLPRKVSILPDAGGTRASSDRLRDSRLPAPILFKTCPIQFSGSSVLSDPSISIFSIAGLDQSTFSEDVKKILGGTVRYLDIRTVRGTSRGKRIIKILLPFCVIGREHCAPDYFSRTGQQPFEGMLVLYAQEGSTIDRYLYLFRPGKPVFCGLQTGGWVCESSPGGWKTDRPMYLTANNIDIIAQDNVIQGYYTGGPGISIRDLLGGGSADQCIARAGTRYHGQDLDYAIQECRR